MVSYTIIKKKKNLEQDLACSEKMIVMQTIIIMPHTDIMIVVIHNR